MAANYETLQVPFIKGMDTRTHPHLIDPPGLTTCKNAQFDEVGLSFRYPFATIGTSIYPSGTISAVRKLAVVNDELLAFTATELYSWSSTLSKWLLRGGHMAVSTAETAVFGNSNDQTFADRAQLGNLIVYVWTEVAAGSVKNYLAAIDATTRATVIAPVALSPASTTSRPRVVAATSVIFVLYVVAGSGLVCGKITPSAPTWTTTPTLGVVSANENNYDAVQFPSTDKVVTITTATGGASYTVSKTDTDLIAVSSVKARISDSVVALSCSPAGNDRVQIIRVDNTTGATDRVMGDLLVLSTLADSIINQPLGIVTALTVNQIACAHRSTTDGGFYRCYVFWSTSEADAVSDNAAAATRYGYVDTSGAIGAEAVLVYRNGVASRAFDYGGHVYVWTTFGVASNAEQLAVAGDLVLGFEVQIQNTNYLYDDTGEFHAKAAWSKAGGFGYYGGHLAGVALVSGTTGYATATTWQGFTDLEGVKVGSFGEGVAAGGDRGPADVVFTFDSDAARRVVQLGQTAYVSGGMIWQYDGDSLTETGFEQFPWFINTADVAAGTLAVGTYNYKLSLRWVNARGESERSTTAIGRAQVVAANREVGWWASRLRVTRKKSSRRRPAIEMWRTVVNAPDDAPYYLVTSRDPSATGDNGYVENDETAVLAVRDQIDSMADFTVAGAVTTYVLINKTAHPENGAVLPRLAPPPATILAVSDARMFLAGIPGEPNRIWYSLTRNDGEIVGFHPALSITLPVETGAVTALAVVDRTLIAWTATATYVVTGDGLDNTGGGANYEARLAPGGRGIGCLSQDSVAVSPVGTFFFSRRGWYRLTSGWDLDFVGAKVDGYNSDWLASAGGGSGGGGGSSVVIATDALWSVQVVEAQHQIRIGSAAPRILVYDWLANEWTEWTEGAAARSLATWRGAAMMATATDVKQQATTLTGADYDLDIETGWFKPSGPQGRNRVRWIEVLGEFKIAHSRRVRVGVNYTTSAYSDDKTLALTGTAGNAAQTRLGPRVQQVQSMRVRVTVAASAAGGDNVILTGLSLEVAPERGLRRGNPSLNQ